MRRTLQGAVNIFSFMGEEHLALENKKMYQKVLLMKMPAPNEYISKKGSIII